MMACANASNILGEATSASGNTSIEAMRGIEDTETTVDELREAFGEKITSIVLEVTDDKSLPKVARKQAQVDHAAHISSEAKTVKLADKICNLRDILNSPPAGWSIERKREYFQWAARVVAGVRGTNAKLEAIFDGLLDEFEQKIA